MPSVLKFISNARQLCHVSCAVLPFADTQTATPDGSKGT